LAAPVDTTKRPPTVTNLPRSAAGYVSLNP
jgi:hypothetical protein